MPTPAPSNDQRSTRATAAKTALLGTTVFSVCLLLTHVPAPAEDQPRKETTRPAAAAVSGLRTVPGSPQREFSKPVPEGAADLQALEKQLRQVSGPMIAATVAVQLGGTQGSGVIVTRDGYVLTAAHVAGSPGRDVTLILSDGRRVDARSLGLNANTDVGLLKITDAGVYPFAEMSDLKNLKIGDWCVAMGHPGGYESGRPAVLRLGRVVVTKEHVLQTDCTLVGGDSGGPLFDLDGHVIGVNSRIGAPTTLNLHVPIRAFTEHWERFVRSEQLDAKPVARKAVLGVDGADGAKGARITSVFSKWPADAAGLRTGDVITKIDGQAVPSFEGLKQQLAVKSPGDTVKIEVLRDGKTLEMSAVLVGLP